MSLLFSMGYIDAQEKVSFDVKAPETVTVGEQFCLVYTLTNAEGKNLKMDKDPDGFDLQYGPSQSTSHNTRIVKGERVTTTVQSFVYILVAKKEGNFKLPSVSIETDKKTYKSKTLSIKVVSRGKDNKANAAANNKKRKNSAASAINESDAFVKVVVEKVEIDKKEAFEVTFRLYAAVNVEGVSDSNFPDFKDFDVIRSWTPNKSMYKSRYNDRNYYTADIRKFILLPKRSGEITVSGGNVEIIYNVKSGEVEETFFGPVEKVIRQKKSLPIESFTIDAGLVGDWKLAEMVSEKETLMNVL